MRVLLILVFPHGPPTVWTPPLRGIVPTNSSIGPSGEATAILASRRPREVKKSPFLIGQPVEVRRKPIHFTHLIYGLQIPMPVRPVLSWRNTRKHGFPAKLRCGETVLEGVKTVLGQVGHTTLKGSEVTRNPRKRDVVLQRLDNNPGKLPWSSQ